MAENEEQKIVLQILKIRDKEYNSAEILENFKQILEYFVDSPKTTPDLEKLNSFIDMLWKRKYFEKALVVIEEAGKKYPGDRNLVEKMGEILIDAEKFEEALELFRELNELYPNNCNYLEYMAASYYGLKMYDEAKEAYLAALENSEGNPGFLMIRFDAMEQIARICYKRKNYDEALEYLEEILTIHPRTTKWHLYFKILEKLGFEKELEEAKVSYQEIKKGKRYQSRGLKYERQKKPESAIRNYKKAIDCNPFEPQYFFSVGNVLEKLPEDEYEFQFEEATTYYKKAVELYPNNVFYLLALIGNMNTTRDWEEAFRIAGEAGNKFPELMLPSLRHLSFVLGKEPKYMELLRRYIENDTEKKYIELRTELAIMLKERKKKEAERWFREATDIYLKKLEYHPYSWRNYWDFANCQLELGHLEIAVENFRKAAELKGDFSVDIAEKLAEVYYKMDDFENAGFILTKLIPLYKNDYEYYGKLGMCFLYEQDYEKAFEAFNRSLAINRYVPEYLYGAAVSAARLGLTEDAINIIKDLLEMEPHFIKIIQLEDAFLEVKETKQFLQMLHAHKANAMKPASPNIKLKKFILPKKSGKEAIEAIPGSKKIGMKIEGKQDGVLNGAATFSDEEWDVFLRGLDEEGIEI